MASTHRAALSHLRRADPLLGEIIVRVGATPPAPRRSGTHYEALVRAIVYQQLSGKAAGTIHRRFCALYPRRRPRAELVLTTSDEALPGDPARLAALGACHAAADRDSDDLRRTLHRLAQLRLAGDGTAADDRELVEVLLAAAAEAICARLRTVPRLAAFVDAYLPDDRHDPTWKLWFEGWLRSASRAEFAEVGNEADRDWHADLVACLEDVGPLPEPAADFARRFLILLDGLAIHVLADHIGVDEAKAHAMAALRSELG